MKVIQSGNPAGAWSKEYSCTGLGNGNGGCGAILEVNGNDIMHTYYTIMGREECHCFTIECPECKTWTDLIESDIPVAIRSKILKLPNCVQNDPTRRHTLGNTTI